MADKNRLILVALAGAASLAIFACSPVADEGAEAEVSATIEDGDATLAGVLGDLENSATLRRAVEEAGFASLMDGSGTYTLLAPGDDAFDALGERATALMAQEQRPLLVAVLREHMLPGHVTPEAIADAVEQQQGSVEMTTVGGGTITFSREGETIVATNSAGASARISGAALGASNGTVIPIDAVLLPETGGEGQAATTS